MKISEILKEIGFYSQDIKTRFKNNQVKLNNKLIADIDISVEFYLEADEFIFNLISEKHGYRVLFNIIGYKDLFGSNEQFLSSFNLLEVSKKESYILF